MKIFSNPLRRLDTIAIHADLKEKTLSDLQNLGETILERCEESLKEHDESKGDKPAAENQEGGSKKQRERGPQFKMAGVPINAKTLMASLEELAPLDKVIPHSTVERSSWVLQVKKVKNTQFDVPWGIQEDSRLLQGIYEYGMSTWEQIRDDSTLNLEDKIFLVGDSKPQRKHLESRAQYLFKLIRKNLDLGTIKIEEKNSRKKMKKDDAKGSSSKKSDNEHSKQQGCPSKLQKEAVKGFTDAEIRRFVKSLKVFSNPLRRMDTIAVNADLTKKSIPDLQKLGESLLERCEESLKEHKENKGDKSAADNQEEGGLKKQRVLLQFKMAGVPVNAKTLMAAVEELAPLDKVVPHSTVERDSWVLQVKKVKDAQFDVPWDVQEDSRLLRGIYEHGMGAWKQIRDDPALNLEDKIFLLGESKPQGKHLESRAQYLFKLIKKNLDLATAKTVKVKPHKIEKEPKGDISKDLINNGNKTNDEAIQMTQLFEGIVKKVKTPKPKKGRKIKAEKEEETVSVDGGEKIKVKEESDEDKKDKKKKEKKEKENKERSEGSIHNSSNVEPVTCDSHGRELNETHPLWAEEKMNPVRKALESLDNPKENLTQEETIQHTRKYLIQIGNHIEKCLETFEDLDTIKKLTRLLWQYASKFTEYDAKKLHKLYKKSRKADEDEKKKKGDTETKSSIVYEEKKENEEKDEKKEHKDNKENKDHKGHKDPMQYKEHIVKEEKIEEEKDEKKEHEEMEHEDHKENKDHKEYDNHNEHEGEKEQSENKEDNKVKKERQIKAEIKDENGSEQGSDKIEVKEKIGEDTKDKTKKEKEKFKEQKEKSPGYITAKGEPVSCNSEGQELDKTHPLWAKCKELMHPMKKALKTLDNPKENLSQEEQVQHTRKYLIQIGDHIEKCFETFKDPDSMREMKSLLWQFVAKFTEYDAKRLHKLYKKNRKSDGDEKEKKYGTETKPSIVNKEKKEEKKEEKKDEKKGHKDHKENKDRKEHKDQKERKENKQKENKVEKEQKENKNNKVKDSSSGGGNIDKPYPQGTKRRLDEEDGHNKPNKKTCNERTDRGRDGSKNWGDRDRNRDRDRERDRMDRDHGRDRDRDRNYHKDSRGRQWQGGNGKDYKERRHHPQDYNKRDQYHDGRRGGWGGRQQDYGGHPGGSASYPQPGWGGGPPPHRPPQQGGRGIPPHRPPPQGGRGGHPHWGPSSHGHAGDSRDGNRNDPRNNGPPGPYPPGPSHPPGERPQGGPWSMAS